MSKRVIRAPDPSSGRIVPMVNRAFVGRREDLQPLAQLSAKQLREVNLVAYHMWEVSRHRIAAFDSQTSTVFLTGPAPWPFFEAGINQRYHAENLRDALDAPGEWFLERDGTLLLNIHHIGRGVLSDMGGVYTLGVSTGTSVSNNVIHDVDSYDRYGRGGWGLYNDEGSTSIRLENNLVYNTATGGYHQHYGRENLVQNNIFALARDGQIQRSRAERHISFTFEHNIVYWKDGPLLAGTWSDQNFRMDHNLYFNARGQAVSFGGQSLPRWREATGQDQHSQIADPMFVNPD
jgi:hypothetical protein